ncbi:MAG: pyridoxamine 5'-phosphate oxidase [Hyphomicrobiaceae bacterium]
MDATEPFQLFEHWFEAARTHELNDPEAMAVASVDTDGMPNVRMVLLKALDPPGRPDRGFVFYTNLESAKGIELLASQKAALLFHWKSLRRQVRIRGTVGVASDAEADAYFATRARGSRIGAWASRQSRPMSSRYALKKAAAAYGLKYAIGDIPRPPQWSGFRVTPLEIEFWHDRPFRLHDRLVFRRDSVSSEWRRDWLFP